MYTVEKFDTATDEDWIQYIERMEYYFQANKVTIEDTKKTVLISKMGEKVYKLIYNHFTCIFSISLRDGTML